MDRKEKIKQTNLFKYSSEHKKILNSWFFKFVYTVFVGYWSLWRTNKREKESKLIQF